VLLEVILDELPAEQDRLFAPWTNMRRDIKKACDRVGIDPVSPNDLRRTFGSWLKNRGLDSAVIARLMGHSSTRMVDKVYGQLNDDTLAEAMEQLSEIQMAEVPRGRAKAPPSQQQVAIASAGGPQAGGSKYGSRPVAICATTETSGQDQALTCSLGDGSSSSENQREPFKKATAPTSFEVGAALPRDRIEPPTRGFSVPCSTD
jgi:hypothetical protein